MAAGAHRNDVAALVAVQERRRGDVRHWQRQWPRELGLLGHPHALARLGVENTQVVALAARSQPRQAVGTAQRRHWAFAGRESHRRLRLASELCAGLAQRAVDGKALHGDLAACRRRGKGPG